MNPFVGIASVLGGLGVLMGTVKVFQMRGIVGAELARKLVHMGMGVLCLTFPWVFKQIWPVWVLAAFAVLGLLALRQISSLRKSLGGVLHQVGRSSWGEVYFPVGVALVFTLARGDWLLFVVPIALLTFADAAGALVGKQWGRYHYVTLEGTKSIEGSLAVGTMGFLCAALPLLKSGYDPERVVVISGLVGLFGLLVEAIAWRGLDNIFLPLAAFAQLSIYLRTPLPALALRLAVLIFVTLAALTWRRGHIVDDSARLGAALALYFFWAVGGWPWLLPPLLLIVCYVRVLPSIPNLKRHDLVAIICISSVGLVWGVAQAVEPRSTWLWFFTLGLATHQAIIGFVRFSQAHPEWPKPVWWAIGATQATVSQVGLFWILDRGANVAPLQLAEGAAAVALTAGVFAALERNPQIPADLNVRWWKQGASGLLASLAGFVATGL